MRMFVRALALATALGAMYASAALGWQSAEKRARVEAKGIGVCAWLAGPWEELEEGGRTEEHWLPPYAGSMVGSCRITRDGKVTMYEFMLIEQVGDDVELRIRHYLWNMKDRDEAPLVWKLAKWSEQELVFENPTRERVRRIEYRRDGDASLVCSLASVKGGQEERMEFRFRRAPAAAGPEGEKSP